MQAQLTSEEYGKDGGFHCPVCGSTNLQLPDIRFAMLFCKACGAEWLETYSITGYCRLRQGNRHKKEVN